MRKASDLMVGTHQLLVVALDGQQTGRNGAKRATSDNKLKSGIAGKDNPERIPELSPWS
jgi:hypothetical protein